jgi:hypothetical protein
MNSSNIKNNVIFRSLLAEWDFFQDVNKLTWGLILERFEYLGTAIQKKYINEFTYLVDLRRKQVRRELEKCPLLSL